MENSLKVLGMITGETGTKRFDETNEEVSIKYNTFLVEDIKNKEKYYIHVDEISSPKSVLGRIDIERYADEKQLTHVPVKNTYIEGFSINPKTLSYSYTPVPSTDENVLRTYAEMMYDAEMRMDNDFDDRDMIERRTDAIDRYVKENTKYHDDYVANNVFTCKMCRNPEMKGVTINEGLFQQQQTLYHMVDKVKFDSGIEGSDTVFLKSIKTGFPTKLSGLPKDMEFNKDTEIELRSSTKERKNIDCLVVFQKDKEGNVTSEQTYERGADGKFKKQAKSQGKQPQQYQLTSDKTYEI